MGFCPFIEIKHMRSIMHLCTKTYHDLYTSDADTSIVLFQFITNKAKCDIVKAKATNQYTAHVSGCPSLTSWEWHKGKLGKINLGHQTGVGKICAITVGCLRQAVIENVTLIPHFQKWHLLKCVQCANNSNTVIKPIFHTLRILLI